MTLTRRSFVKSGLAAGSLFLPLPYARVWAQSEGTMKLLRLPKIALVLGNSKYKESPLKNPANDAAAIAAALKSAGFAVTSKLDASRADMAAAVDAYTKELAAKKCVGLFYYAGHGIQLAWKNYMLPVDADIDTIADVQKQAVEVNSLLEGITRAKNPMNVIILDACRDNPFGSTRGVEQKGLSQMDAPHSTLLAYATSPGNTASDGEGANGLYTEHLLRELKVPEAKVEDVFKRVRLGVRRKSGGAQIPWESTSLEEDFWFIPPAELKKRSDAEKQKAFDDELRLWESIRESKTPAPLEDYLRRYPSGEYAELAQLALDRVLAREGEKRIAVAAQEGNPFTKGHARADVDYKIGDFYEYRILDLASKAELRTTRSDVTAVTESEITFGNGAVLDRLGNLRRSASGFRFTDSQNMPLEFQVGHRWTTEFRTFPPGVPENIRVMTNLEYRITAKERLTVPAGTFECFRIEGRGRATFARGYGDLTYVTWYAPDKVRRFVAQEFTRKVSPGNPLPNEATRMELTSYKQT